VTGPVRVPAPRTTRHKAVASAFAAVATVVAAALLDQAVSVPEWGEIAGAAVVAGLGVFAVWRTPNEPL
jgi:hypothetical protein